MRDVVIKTGVYGHRHEKNRVRPVAKGERVSLPDEEAARLVALDVAAYVDTTAKVPNTPPAPPSGGKEPEGRHQDTPSEEEPTEGATSGESDDPESVNISRLERMPKADLEQMAQDMGIDISGAKNNRERAELIAAAEETYEELPELEDGDIVR